MKRIYSFLCVALLVASCSKKDTTTPGTGNGGGTNNPPVTTTITPPPSLGFYVVGYIPSYRSASSIADNKFKMCNVINYAFASVTSTGDLSLAVPANFTAVQAKAKTYGTKLFISINGSTTDWKNMALTAAGRTAFIKKAMNMARAYALDGIDIDWEYPTTSDGSDAMYTSLMKELSDSCHTDAKYYLSTALTPGRYSGGIRDAIKDEILKGSYVDFFNIMVYDDFSTSVPYKQHSDYALAQYCLNYWINTRGTPASKVVLGLPAYGRPSGITQTNTVLSYSTILAQVPSASQVDSAVVTAGGFTNYTIYYNGQYTIKRKAMLAKTTAGGIMMWELGQDTNDGNSLMKAACDTLGRAY